MGSPWGGGDIALVILLPLFFVLTGLRTQIGLLNSSHLLIFALIIILIAIKLNLPVTLDMFLKIE